MSEQTYTERHYIMAHRTTNSILGSASRPVNSNGATTFFPSEDVARDEVTRRNKECASPNVYYTYGGQLS